MDGGSGFTAEAHGVKAAIKRGLARCGYRVQGTRYIPRQLLDARYERRLELRDVLCRRMFMAGAGLTFVQIGAFDGITADPLHEYIGRYGWRGVLVEAQPQAASRLRDLYRGNNRIVVLEAAVDTTRGARSLFTVDADAAPAWAGGMASFDRAHISKHRYLIPDIEARIQEIVVPCIVCDDVLQHLSSDDLDVLQIDAEGADGQILASFPFERVRPAIVHWEIRNLTTSEREACFDRLIPFGYRFAPSGDADMLALLD